LLKPFWVVFRDALPARAHVVIDHFRNHGKLPDLQHPATFSEKIAYRKLYDRDPRIPSLVDKITAKEKMASRFGTDFIIPTLATFDREAEIDFAVLPYPCVVKPNRASGFNVFLGERPEKERKVRRRLGRLLRYRHERASEEWAYSQIAPRLLVEPWVVESGIEGGEHGLVDYKFHTFSGQVFSIQVDVDRYAHHRRNFFDPSWTPMQFELLYPRAAHEIPRPVALKEMLRYAAQIGEGFAYVRVDLYEVAGKAKFGEVTFYPGAGLEVFNPPEFDAVFGALWN
jgi:TupA-like ATPgrasp